MSNGERRTESGGPSAAGGGRQAGSPVRRVSAGPLPPTPPRLPPGSAPARGRRVARPRPLLLLFFLVPEGTPGSEEPGEAVPGGAAPPTAAGHHPGAAAGPGPSAGNGRAKRCPELGARPGAAGPGERYTASAAGAAPSIPGGRVLAPPVPARQLLALRGGSSSRPRPGEEPAAAARPAPPQAPPQAPPLPAMAPPSRDPALDPGPAPLRPRPRPGPAPLRPRPPLARCGLEAPPRLRDSAPPRPA